LSCQGLLHLPQPAQSLLGEGLTPALQGSQGRGSRFGAACYNLRPGTSLLKPGTQSCLDALHQVMSPGQQKARQTTTCAPAQLALPTLHPDRIGPLLILWLALVVPMPDQAACRLASGALLRTRAIALFFLLAIRLRIRSKIDYNSGRWSGLGAVFPRRQLSGRTSFLCAMIALSYRIIWTRKAALLGAACCLPTSDSSIYSRPFALIPAT
jgi:hypothetical protein